MFRVKNTITSSIAWCHAEQEAAAAHLLEHDDGNPHGARLWLADWCAEEALILTEPQR